MGNALFIFVIILVILFLAGIASGVLSLLFAVKGKHPIISIVLAVVCWLGLYFSVKFIIGFIVAGLTAVLIGIFSICVIVISVKNLSKNK